MIKALKRFSDRVGRKKFRTIFSVIFCLPIVLWCFYNDGLKGLLASLFGLVIGQIISNKLLKD